MSSILPTARRPSLPGRRQVNYLAVRKREHSGKPDELYPIIEACSPGPYVELFARGARRHWAGWGDQAEVAYRPTWHTYKHHSAARAGAE
jgi:N6-adenosine-specific RNA methylase IME4